MSEREAELIAAARKVRQHAYAPYSGFKVGAAVRGASGKLYLGCNVENVSYGATCCAERNAVAALVAAGETEVVEVCVFTEAAELTTPCGVCRQVIWEFGQGARVLCVSGAGQRWFQIGELLPEAFGFRPPSSG